MHPVLGALAGIALSAVVLGLCSQIHGWWYLLDFFGLVPWLLSLDRLRTLRGALASGLAMSLAFVVAIFVWFGFAIAEYSAGAAAAGLVVLLLASPLLQPQFAVFSGVRFLAGRGGGGAPLRILAGASAWVAAEWLFPKLLADNLAHGLYPSDVLRQVADLGGTAGITFLLVVVNECVALAASRGRAGGARAALAPAAAALAVVAAMTGYGSMRLAELQQAEASAAPTLRMGMVQSNILAYDRMRREMGAYEAVRHVLDTHYAMSRVAVERDGVDALLWSETVYPTTFGRPKTPDGAALDREIEDFASSVGVPVVFGSYDSDETGEYNSAVFLRPRPGPDGRRYDVYRKTRLFLFTEYVPGWMDGDFARSWMPWAGTWKPGPGARVLPLRTADGREVPVLPMICLDDVDPGLAIAGARAGAQMILAMSNDSWFTEHPAGAWLHLVVAAYRSVETRLPQLRVTHNGMSAVIDPSGAILRRTEVGERAVVVGELPPAAPAATLMVRWGDWVGPTGFVMALLALAVSRLPGGATVPPPAGPAASGSASGATSDGAAGKTAQTSAKRPARVRR